MVGPPVWLEYLLLLILLQLLVLSYNYTAQADSLHPILMLIISEVNLISAFSCKVDVEPFREFSRKHD